MTSTVAETTSMPAKIYTSGTAYTPTATTTFHALYSRTDSDGSGTAGEYSLFSGALEEGDYVIVYDSGAMLAADSDNNDRIDYTEVTISNDTITDPSASIIWHIAPTSDGYYTIYNTANSVFAAGTGTKNKSSVITEVTDYAKWTASGTSTYEFVNLGNKNAGVNANLRKNGTYGFACYSSSTGGALSLYKGVSGTTYYTTSATSCSHSNTTNVAAVAATCTEPGYTAGVYCYGCGAYISGHEQTAALGHNYTSAVTPPAATEQGYTTYTCSRCGDSYVSDYTDALGETYTVAFLVPEGVSSVSSMECGKNGITLPTAGVPTGTYTYAFAGWTTAAVDNSTTAPAILTGSYNATSNITLYAVYTYSVGGTGSSEYVLTDIANISETDSVVVTMTYTDGTVYALSSANGTSKAPDATIVTVSGNKLAADPASDLKWNIGGDSTGYIFYPEGTTDSWLYCTSTNNGVRVGTNAANTFVIDSASGYLKHNGTGRYVGVYRTNPDWRCYTNTTGNTANQTLGFYVKGQGGTTYYTTVIGTECAHNNTSTSTVAATCTAAGSTTVTCNSCGEIVSTTTIASLGHSYKSAVTAPTCTAAGYTTYTCSTCGDSYTADEVAALGHSSSYVDNGDGTHDYVCGTCGTVEVDNESHTYPNGTCVCGAVEEAADPYLDTSLVFMSKALNLNSSILNQFIINPSSLTGYDSFYVTFKHTDADGNVTETTEEGYLYYNVYRVFEIASAAKEMSDTIEVTLYGQKDGVWYHGETLNWVMRDELTAALRASTKATYQTLAATILNYGTAAQNYFSYNTDNPANALLTEAELAYAKTTPDTLTDNSAAVGSGNGVSKIGTTLGLEGAIQMQFIFMSSAYAATDLEAHVSYTIDGTQTTETIDGSELNVIGNYITVLYDGIAAKDLRTVVTVGLYDKSTGELVSPEVSYSAESYCCQKLNAADTANGIHAMCTAVMCYVDAAADYFG